MEKVITYKLKEDMAQAVRGILEKIKYNDFQHKYGLTVEQEVLIHKYLESVKKVEETSN